MQPLIVENAAGAAYRPSINQSKLSAMKIRNFAKTKLHTLGVVLFLLFCCSVSWAQEETGSVNGIVRKESGEPLPGVSVIAKNNETGLSK
ncbi:MAG: carboxypeptidase-like regulatory domain-containing protein, partial [Bacteroidota bacterium]